jgi:hypothetical protein
MKLRIKGNSIRLRLGQSEVRRLLTEGAVEESTQFGPGPDQRFRYALLASEKPGISASFTGQLLSVRVSLDMLRQWHSTDQVGIRAFQPAGDADLTILIEKDFECTEAPLEESQEDAFPRGQFTDVVCVDRLND